MKGQKGSVIVRGWGQSIYDHGWHLWSYRGYALKAFVDRRGWQWEVSLRGAVCGRGAGIDAEHMAAESWSVVIRHLAVEFFPKEAPSCP